MTKPNPLNEIPNFDRLVENRHNNYLINNEKAEIAKILAKGLRIAIDDYRNHTVNLYFSKQRFYIIPIDMVLYDELRPKGYKYEVRENDEYYIVRIPITHKEVTNDENTNAQ